MTGLHLGLLFHLLPISVASAGPPGQPRVVVLDLHYVNDITEGVREALSGRLRQGLAATGMELTPIGQTREAVGRDECLAPPCWRRVARQLGGRFVVGGKVQGEDRTYGLELWLADGHSGKVLARVRRQCDICGLAGVASKMDLAASALRAKAESTAKSPARITIQTDPPAASLLLDGSPAGTAPRELELPPGDHVVVAEAPGHIKTTRTIQAVAGVEERVELKLIRAAAAEGRSYRPLAGWLAGPRCRRDERGAGHGAVRRERPPRGL